MDSLWVGFFHESVQFGIQTSEDNMDSLTLNQFSIQFDIFILHSHFVAMIQFLKDLCQLPIIRAKKLSILYSGENLLILIL